MPSKSVCSALVAEHSYGYETVYYYALRIYKCASVSSSQKLTIMAVSNFVNSIYWIYIHNVVTFHSHCITLDHIGSHWIHHGNICRITYALHYIAAHYITLQHITHYDLFSLILIFWHTGKTTMYFIFYSRLQLAFYDTA
eukprot:226234_1